MTDLLDRPRPRIDPRIAQRWVEARRQEGRRRLRVLVAVAVVAALAGAAIGSLYTPLFALRHVRVTLSGASSVGVARVEAEAGLLHHPLMVDVSPASVARRLDSDPLLGAARVVKHWPSTVTVSVVERSPLAQVPVSAGSGSGQYVVVDETGRVLGVPAARIPGMALIQGIGSVPSTGGWLPASPGQSASPQSAATSLVDMNAASDAPDVPRGASVALALLRALPPELRAAVQSVNVGGAGPSLVIAPPSQPTGTLAVTLGDGSDLAAKVTALQTLLAQAPLTGIASIDLSVPTRPAAVPAQAPATAGSSAVTGSTGGPPAAGSPSAASTAGSAVGSTSQASG